MKLQEINDACRSAALIRPVTGDPMKTSLRAVYPKLHLTTVADYFEAMSAKADNEAGREIDAGREPFLVSDEALFMNMEPFIAVYDVMIDAQNVGNVVLYCLDLPSGSCLVPGDCLLAWR